MQQVFTDYIHPFFASCMGHHQLLCAGIWHRVSREYSQSSVFLQMLLWLWQRHSM